MSLSKQNYPWFFFFRSIRIFLLIYLPIIIAFLFTYQSAHKKDQHDLLRHEALASLQPLISLLPQSPADPSFCKRLLNLKMPLALMNSSSSVVCKNFDFFPLGGKKLPEFQGEGFTELNTDLPRPAQVLYAGQKIGDYVLIRAIPIKEHNLAIASFNMELFLRFLPFLVLGLIFFILMSYEAMKPLGNVIHKVQKLKDKMPLDVSLKQLYKRDEWAILDEALSKADKKIQYQMEQVHTENKKISAILESIYDDIIAIDNFETVLFFNSNFERNFLQRVDEGAEIIPKIWHTFSDQEVLGAFRRALKTGHRESIKGIPFRTKESSLDKHFDLTVTPLRDVEGKIVGALGVFYDVTEFKRTEQMRVDFVANVSHEIRTPLTSIKGYTQILQGQANSLPEELRPFLGKIVGNTERMISLFNDLLSLSVIEAQNKIRFVELDLDSMIMSISDNIITNYSHKKVTIDHDLNLPLIRGDHQLMEQVISNLVDNACKYSGEEISIKISTFRKNEKGYIVVADKGPGISQEHLQRIFERFYRVDSSRESMRGTGLGLSIVKHIINKHEGRIWAESEENKGTNFIIELPLS